MEEKMLITLRLYETPINDNHDECTRMRNVQQFVYSKGIIAGGTSHTSQVLLFLSPSTAVGGE